MIIKNSNRNCFNDEGHLDDNAIALYVDALILDKVEAQPASVLQHVEDCMQCKTSIIGLYEVLKDNEEIKNRKHPYFHRTSWGSQYQWIKMAAIFLGFLIVGASIYSLFIKQKDYQALYAQNFEPYDDVITERGVVNSAHDTMFYAILTDYYNQGDFDQASILFEKLYNPNKPNDSLLFYYANSCLAIGASAEAIRLFTEMSAYEKSIFYHQSRWYLALAYLDVAANSTGKKQEEMLLNSKNVLKAIIDNNSPFAEKASALLSKY